MSMGSVILVQTWKSWSIEQGGTARERDKGSFGLFDQIVLTQGRQEPLISHPRKREKENETVTAGRKSTTVCLIRLIYVQPDFVLTFS